MVSTSSVANSRAVLFAVALPLTPCLFGGLVQVDVLVHTRHPRERNEVVLAPGGRVVLGELDAVGGCVKSLSLP